MKSCFKSIKLLIKTQPSYLLLQFFSCVISVLMSLIPIRIIDEIINMYQENAEIKDVIKFIIIRFAILALLDVCVKIINILKMKVQRIFIAKASLLFYKKVENVDYDFHESPEFLNGYTRSLEMGAENIYTVANSFFEVLIKLVQSVAIFNVISNIDNRIIYVVIGLAIVYILIFVRIGFLNKKENTIKRPLQRAAWYNRRTFVLKDSMADIKTTNIDKMLIENNEKSFKGIIKVMDKYRSKTTIWSMFAEIIMMCMYPLIIALIAYFTTDIKNHLDDFAAMTVAATTLTTIISGLTSGIGRLEGALPEVHIPFDLLKIESKIENGKGKEFNEEFRELEIKNLDFSYDNECLHLNDISLKIKKGEHIAIVGANGAGKTTLVKMLLRLYDPKNGDIYINGQNYKDLEVRSMRKVVGAVFQNIETYALTIGENILLREIKTEEDIELVNESLKFSGLYDFVYSLDKNINTMITREFDRDGVVFSGGQNQRLALARGYAQNYQLFILDEPSSALDPFAEAEVYKNMLEIGKEKSIIFISHRLTTTVNADKIYLFDKAKVLESGTHEELMNLKGKYFEMFESQSKKYLGEDYE